MANSSTAKKSGGAAKKTAGTPKTPVGGDQDKPKLIHVKGQTYRLPDTAEDMSLETLNAFEEGRATSAIKGAVGEVAWRQMNAAGVKVRDLDDIMSQIAKAYGFEGLGESGAS